MVVEGNQKEHIMEGGRSKIEENNHAKKKEEHIMRGRDYGGADITEKMEKEKESKIT